MLVLSRKKDEKIIIGDKIAIMVVDIQGDKVRLGIEAPRDVTVHREEVYQAIQKKQAEPGTDPQNSLAGGSDTDELVGNAINTGGYDPSAPKQDHGGGKGRRNRHNRR